VDRYARWNALLEVLTEDGRVSVEDAADRLPFSQATIRATSTSSPSNR
jgi:DeoR family transcriptional regulator of aga operon